MSKITSDMPTPQSLGGKSDDAKVDSSRASRQFVGLAVQMGWQLAIVVLVPIIGGVELDTLLKTSPVLLFVGLALALAGTVLVMWHTMQTANGLPVPKLSEAQRQAIKKSYEEEDAE